jgi:signal transduction histidine kinase
VDADAPAHPPVAEGRARVLVVDDDPAARAALGAFLAVAGYEIGTAAGVTDALAALVAEPADLVLLDLMMPEIDGIEGCRRIRKVLGDTYVPILIVTALVEPACLAAALDAGADDFLAKPTVQVELLARVRSALRVKRQHDALRQLLHMRARLASLVAHDLHGPLTAIGFAVDLLEEEPTVRAGAGAGLTRIRRSLQRISELATDLTLAARLDQPELRPDREPLDLRALATDVADTLAPVWRRAGAVVRVDGPPTAAVVDGRLLRRLVENLLLNAIGHAPRGSTVRIGVAPVGEARVRIVVEDAGPGVPAVDRERVFAPFVSTGGGPGRFGTGLGLAFCRQVVDAHGGRVWVEDNEPCGARFVVTLPRDGVGSPGPR